MRIALADDEALFRKGIALLLKNAGTYSIEFEASNGKELLEKLDASEMLPDLVLMDLNMPEMNGIETAKILQEKYPDLKFIILSTYFSKSFIINMIESGAAAYLAKDSSPEHMIETIEGVIQNGFYYSQEVMKVVRENMVKKVKQAPSFSFKVDLTDRESEILQLICEEKTTAEIAEILFISPRTVEGHRNNLLSKLDCKNTAGLVIVAIQKGLVDLKKLRLSFE
jgi:DNA-binding NarL/FixJ family response regulator